MYHSIVSTPKAWCYMYAFRRSKTARHDVSAVQSVVEGTFFSFSYLVPKISIILNATLQAREGKYFIHVYNVVYN
jgi:hypothetical protein